MIAAIQLVLIVTFLISCLHIQLNTTTNPGNFVTVFGGIGYDIIKGNPDGDFKTGGIDPGFRMTRSIFKKTYNNKLNSVNTYKGQPIKVPDILRYQERHSCTSKRVVGVYDGSKSYQKKLRVGVGVETGADYGLVKFSFGASAGYEKVRDSIQSERKVVMDQAVTCTTAEVHLFLVRGTSNKVLVSDDFFYSVKQLPLTYDEKKYMNFIKKWGTHLIKKVKVGAKLVDQYESSYGEVYRFASDNVTSSVFGGGGAFDGFSASFRVDIEKFNEQMSATSEFGSHLSTSLSGPVINQPNEKITSWHIDNNDKTAPIPLEYELMSITKAFNRNYWSQLPRGATYYSVAAGTKLKNVEKALRRYPQFLKVEESSDPEIKVPNAWPDGSYSLVKTIFGCPGSGNGFTWEEGRVVQDYEDDWYRYFRGSIRSPVYQCMSPLWYLLLSVRCTRDLFTTSYCSKTVESGDRYGVTWPKGAYCIGRKNKCPSGFSDASIFWDDENDKNSNLFVGTVPDGEYDHNTKIFYCCRNDRHPHNEIVLPTEKPFILMRNHQDSCQKVKGMQEIDLFVIIDDEDDNNTSKGEGIQGINQKYRGNLLVHYCFYRPPNLNFDELPIISDAEF